MKTCGYCGRENPDDASICSGCGTEFPKSKSFQQLQQPNESLPNLKILVVVFLRLVALNFALDAILGCMEFLGRESVIRINQGSFGELATTILPWLLLGILIGSAALLWVFALPIARFATRPIRRDVSIAGVSLADAYSVAFIGIGLFFIVGRLGSAVYWIQYLLRVADSMSGNLFENEARLRSLAQVFVPLIAGVVLLLNGRKWAVALARRDHKAVEFSGDSELMNSPAGSDSTTHS